MPLNLQKYIGQMTTQLQPMLDAFLQALGVRTGREEKRTLQKAQQMGRVTTGFLPEMQREVREEAGMQEAQYRGGHAQNIMQLAMQLFGVESEWERFRRELEWKAQQSELDRALQRELAKLGRGGEGGFTFPGFPGGDEGLPPLPELSLVAKGLAKRGAIEPGSYTRYLEAKQPRLKYPGGLGVRPKTTTEVPKPTTYRGTRLGRI